MQQFLDNNDLTMFIFNNYESGIIDFMKIVNKRKCRICHVLTRTPVTYFSQELRQNNLMSENLYFIDVLSKHFGNKKNSKNCVYLDYPNLDKILKAVEKQVTNNECQIILYDNISSLLKYHSRYKIQEMTNKLKSTPYSMTKIIFLVPKKDELAQEEHQKLLNDLVLFVDSIQEFS